jgi:hypothetical protein
MLRSTHGAREAGEEWGKSRVDGKPRSYREIKAVAFESAEFLKAKNPNSNVAVKDLRTGEVTPVAFRPQRV